MTIVILLCLAAAGALPAAAPARWVVKGHGYGHGIGLSQYGAFGLAKHGRSYRSILHRYYKHTTISRTKSRKVRVLLSAGVGSLPFGGATEACGKRLKSGRHYSFVPSGSRVKLAGAHGKILKNCGHEGGARGGVSVDYLGKGAYRGTLIGRSVGGSIYAINKVEIDSYVKGVIPNESPASWPMAALKAQAVAARSYALATGVDGNGYDLYNDTRSQVYGGRSSEQPRSNTAARRTEREVVKYHGKVAVTYFSSTSGGKTENVEYSFVGSSPAPYLKGVKDPYDGASPYHSWRFSLSNGAMASKLSGLYSGHLQRIKILKTGFSPRIVRAKVIGSGRSTRVTGPTLQYRLGMRSTWAKFCKSGKKCTGGSSSGGGGSGGGGSGGGVGTK